MPVLSTHSYYPLEFLKGYLLQRSKIYPIIQFVAPWALWIYGKFILMFTYYFFSDVSANSTERCFKPVRHAKCTVTYCITLRTYAQFVRS